MDKNDDWNNKKEGFLEVLKLMDMINKSQQSEWVKLARVIWDMFDGLMKVGFTREEALEITKSMIGNLGRS